MDVEHSEKGVIAMPRPPSRVSKKKAKFNLDLAEKIKAVRKQRGLSQIELAERIGETQRVVSHYELGQSRIPAETLGKIAKTLRVSLSEFFNGKMEVKPPKNGREIRAVVEKLEVLPPKKQRQVVEYVDMLASRHSQNAVV